MDDEEFKGITPERAAELCGACKLDLKGLQVGSYCPRCGITWPTPPEMQDEYSEGGIC